MTKPSKGKTVGGGKSRGRRLPGRLRPFFWEYDFASLRWNGDRDLVIERILTAGTWDAITWLRSRMGDAELRAWIERRQGASLSPRQLRFWELILGLPHRQVSAWLAKLGRAVWDQRTYS
jgi:hypothetical protein